MVLSHQKKAAGYTHAHTQHIFFIGKITHLSSFKGKFSSTTVLVRACLLTSTLKNALLAAEPGRTVHGQPLLNSVSLLLLLEQGVGHCIAAEDLDDAACTVNDPHDAHQLAHNLWPRGSSGSTNKLSG